MKVDLTKIEVGDVILRKRFGGCAPKLTIVSVAPANGVVGFPNHCGGSTTVDAEAILKHWPSIEEPERDLRAAIKSYLKENPESMAWDIREGIAKTRYETILGLVRKMVKEGKLIEPDSNCSYSLPPEKTPEKTLEERIFEALYLDDKWTPETHIVKKIQDYSPVEIYRTLAHSGSFKFFIGDFSGVSMVRREEPVSKKK